MRETRVHKLLLVLDFLRALLVDLMHVSEGRVTLEDLLRGQPFWQV